MNYTQKVPRAFINFTSTHFSLIVKNCFAIGTQRLILKLENPSQQVGSALLIDIFHEVSL